MITVIHLIPIIQYAIRRVRHCVPDVGTRTYYAGGVHEAATNSGTVNTRVLAGSVDNVHSAVEIVVSVVVGSSDVVVMAADWVYVHRTAGPVGQYPCISLGTWSCRHTGGGGIDRHPQFAYILPLPLFKVFLEISIL